MFGSFQVCDFFFFFFFCSFIKKFQFHPLFVWQTSEWHIELWCEFYLFIYFSYRPNQKDHVDLIYLCLFTEGHQNVQLFELFSGQEWRLNEQQCIWLFFSFGKYDHLIILLGRQKKMKKKKRNNRIRRTPNTLHKWFHKFVCCLIFLSFIIWRHGHTTYRIQNTD